MNQNRKVGIYLRLSKEDEKDGESSSISNQRAILFEYIKNNNLEYVDEYIDDGVSGTTFDRVGFKRMLFDIDNKRINMVITKDTSRLGRDHIEFGFYVERYFPEHNVRYVAVCDGIDTECNYNDMLLFKSIYNDMYVKDISNKIRASLNIKKRNGEFVGAYAPYGYKKCNLDKHKLVIDEKACGVVRYIYRLFLEGNSVTKIKDILTNEGIETPSCYKGMKSRSLYGIWNTRTITDILTNPTYMGNLSQGRAKKVSYKSKKRVHVSRDNWIIKNNSCPKIIDVNTFNLVQELYQRNRYKRENNILNKLILKGVVYCEECGHKIGFRRVTRVNKDNVKITRYYGNCNYYLKNKKQNLCTPHSISYYDLENVVVKNIFDLLLNVDKDKIISKLESMELNSDRDSNKRRITMLENELNKIKIKKENLYDDKLSGFINRDIYINMRNKLEMESIRLNRELDVERSIRNRIGKIKWGYYLEYGLKNIDFYLINYLVKKITLNEKGVVKVYYKIKN